MTTATTRRRELLLHAGESIHARDIVHLIPSPRSLSTPNGRHASNSPSDEAALSSARSTAGRRSIVVSTTAGLQPPIDRARGRERGGRGEGGPGKEGGGAMSRRRQCLFDERGDALPLSTRSCEPLHVARCRDRCTAQGSRASAKGAKSVPVAAVSFAGWTTLLGCMRSIRASRGQQPAAPNHRASCIVHPCLAHREQSPIRDTASLVVRQQPACAAPPRSRPDTRPCRVPPSVAAGVRDTPPSRR